MSRFDLVIFDNDGVLVDSEPLANAVLAEILTGYGLPLTWQDCVERYLGSTLGRVRALVEAELGHAIPDDFEAHYRATVYPRLAESVQPIAGVAAVLDVLADGPGWRVRGVERDPRAHPDHAHHRRADRPVRRAAVQRGGRRRRQAGTRSVPARGGDARTSRRRAARWSRTRRPASRRPTPPDMVVFAYAALTPRHLLAGASGGVFDDMVQLPDLLIGP